MDLPCAWREGKKWPKGFFVQPDKTGTVTREQLAAMFFPLNEL